MADAIGPQLNPAARRRRADLAQVAALLGLTGLMLGGAFLSFRVAGRLGLPTSHGLLFEGVWLASSWEDFPWADCAGMLVFMCALPMAWERRRGVARVAMGLRAGRKAIALTAVGLLCVAAVWAGRRALGAAAPGRAYVGSVDVLVAYWLVVAAAEEFAFRGVLQRRLTAMAGICVALPVATAAFVLWHGLPGSSTVLAVRIAAGLAVGLLYHVSGSLLPAVLCHWALNVALTS